MRARACGACQNGCVTASRAHCVAACTVGGQQAGSSRSSGNSARHCRGTWILGSSLVSPFGYLLLPVAGRALVSAVDHVPLAWCRACRRGCSCALRSSSCSHRRRHRRCRGECMYSRGWCRRRGKVAVGSRGCSPADVSDCATRCGSCVGRGKSSAGCLSREGFLLLSRCTAGCVQIFRAGRGLHLLQLWKLCVVTARRCALRLQR